MAIRGVPLRRLGSRTVEFGPATLERLRSLRCTRTCETCVPFYSSEFSLTPSGHSCVQSVSVYVSVSVSGSAASPASSATSATSVASAGSGRV